MEDASEKHPVTPGHVLPARELLGEMLLELNQPALALKEFEASHKVEPNRFRGLYGAALAAAQSGDMAKAKTYYEELVVLAQNADTERPEIKEAKAFLSKK
jgi:tetratricopeptide (TPR) repeat protein